jgi:hypothetical protein
MPLARLAPALAALVLPAVFAVAQEEPATKARSNAWTAMAEAAFADLNDEAKFAAACERLERAGPRVVEFVRQRLTAEARATASPRQLRGLLYVLAKRGKEALPALPELRTMLYELSDLERNPEVDHAHGWALIAMLPFVDADTAAEVHRESGALATRTEGTGQLLQEVAGFGDDPGEDRLLRRATQRASHLAACRWLTIRGDDYPYDRARCAAALDAFRRTLVVRATSGSDGAIAAEVTDAWLAVARTPLDSVAAVALLRHWDPARRLQAIAWLREQGKELPAEDRAVLGSVAWDPEAAVRTSAATTLAAWGRRGLVGLAALRHLQEKHADATFRVTCATAADAIVAAFDGEPAADRTLVVAIDCCLRGRSAEAPAVTAASAAIRAQVAELLPLAAWSSADRLDAVLHRMAAAGELGVATYQTLAEWLWSRDLDVRAMAWSWLAKQPETARQAFAERAPQSTFEERLLEAVLSAPPYVRGEAIEAMAWLEVGTAPRAGLDHLRTGTPRHVVRALAQLLAHGPGDAQVPAERLRRLLAGEVDEGIKLVQTFQGMHIREVVHAADLRTHVRVLAALQTAAQGLPLPTDDAALDELLTTWCSTTARDLPTTLARWRQDGELRRRLDALEADARAQLRVAPQLSWPRLAKP